MAGRPKGYPKTGGRAPGKCNGDTGKLREMILGALDDVGGRKYLAEQAISNPGPFLSLVARVLPKEVVAEVTGNVTILASVQDQNL